MIHTAGMQFLQDAKVFVEEENTDMRAWDRLSYAPGQRWKRKHRHFMPGTDNWRDSDARWEKATMKCDVAAPVCASALGL